MKSLERLLEISTSIAEEPVHVEKSLEQPTKVAFPILSVRNGLFAFESALMVLPTVVKGCVPSLRQWNDPKGWRVTYKIPEKMVFFAMDLFAEQFGIHGGEVFRLKPESGEIVKHSVSLDDWARRILSDYNHETGFSVVHEWQSKYGRLEPGYRFVGRKPFILGGDYTVANMVPVTATESMRQMVNLFRQIAEIPDGEKVRIVGWLK